MGLTAQIPDVTVGRAANAPHYEYMTTFGKRTAELPVDHELWRKGKDEFDTAFRAEDEAFKRYRDSELTDPIKADDDRVRQLLTERNDERSAQIMGELKAAREATDRAYLTLVRLTNAYALLNPDRAEAQKLVALVSEDLEYFRKHAMAPSHRDKNTPEPDADPATPGETPAEA